MLTRRAAALLNQGREETHDEGSSLSRRQQQRRRLTTPPATPGSSARALSDADSAGESPSPQYIPLPESLWELRRRFPSVTRSVLLQCVRCHRWVAQPVTTSPPQSESHDALRETTPLAVVKAPGDCEQSESHRGSEERGEWRSPRIQLQYEKIVGCIKGKALARSGKKETCPYFIPNPAVFTCQWTYCELEDTWSDLRGKWLGELYAAMDNAKTGTEGARRRRGGTDTQGRQQRLNLELERELYGRRSNRLVDGLHVSAGQRDELDKAQESMLELTHSSATSRQAAALVRNDEAVLAAFCWITCDSCGKLRRVHQPFPGGAPFVCSLALNIGSCSISEVEGVNAVFRSNRFSSSRAGSLAHSAGDAALRRVVQLNNAAPSSRVSHGTARSSTGDHGHDSRSLESSIPLLRSLTAAIRKKSLGGFIKNVLTTPDEVRSKREEVMKASLDLAGERSSDIPKPQLKEEPAATVPNDSARTSNMPQYGVVKVEEESVVRRSEGSQANINPPEGSCSVAGGNNLGGVVAPKHLRRLGCPPRRANWSLGNNTERYSATNGSPEGVSVTQPQNTLARCKVEDAGDDYVATGSGQHNVNLDGGGRRALHLLNGPVESEESKSTPLARQSSSSGSNRVNYAGRQLKLTDMLAQISEGGASSVSGALTSGVSVRKGSAGQGVGAVDRTRATGSKSPRAGEVEDLKSADTDTSDVEEGYEVIHWVCCDLCDKWRILPEKIPGETQRWECTMRGDGTTCDDTDDEVRMKREERCNRSHRTSKRRKV